MKNKYLRYTRSILCAVMMATMVSGCAQGETKEVTEITIEPMEKEEVASYSFDYIGGNDVMPILGYFGPSQVSHSYDGNSQPSNLTDEWFQMVADCGINVLPYPQIDYKTASQSVMKMLDLADKYGIGMGVFDSNVMNDYDITKEEAIDKMQEYMTHPAYVGFFLYDEPGNANFISFRTHLSQLENLSKVLNKELNMWNYLNLCGADIEEKDVYVDYVKEYCETQYPKYLSYDKYPAMSPTAVKQQSDYLWNMAIIRQNAIEYNLPWWMYIAAGGQWNDARSYKESVEYYPNEGVFDWNVNTALAFGAKGINYFALSQPYWFAYGPAEGEYDFERNSLIGAYGNKNQWYYYAQKMNNHIAVIDEVLMNSVSKGMIISVDEETSKRDMKGLSEENYVDMSAFIEGTSWRELEDVSGNVLVGCFNYQGKTALYVVNYSYDYAQKINLEFVSECNVRVVQQAETSYVKTDSLVLDMPAGDGVLLVFE